MLKVTLALVPALIMPALATTRAPALTVTLALAPVLALGLVCTPMLVLIFYAYVCA